MKKTIAKETTKGLDVHFQLSEMCPECTRKTDIALIHAPSFSQSTTLPHFFTGLFFM